MYRRLGIDPTKTRPSSEALLRRVKKGDHLPRINTLVDICNWCSLELQLPYGLYDLSGIEPPIELRLGADGEQYDGHPEGRGARRRPPDAGGSARGVRQPDLGLGADDGDRGDQRGAVRRFRAGRPCRFPSCSGCSTSQRGGFRPSPAPVAAGATSYNFARDHAGGSHCGRRWPGHAPGHRRAQAVPRAGWARDARSQRRGAVAVSCDRANRRRAARGGRGQPAATICGRDAARARPSKAARGDRTRSRMRSPPSPPDTDVVVIHDAARPFVDRATIERTIEAAACGRRRDCRASGGRHREAGRHHRDRLGRRRVRRAAASCAAEARARGEEDADRETIFLAQTPQAFRRDVLARAIAHGRRAPRGPTRRRSPSSSARRCCSCRAIRAT